jgi:DUF4097 and DUF4098 domain-containing protein YvlB
MSKNTIMKKMNITRWLLILLLMVTGANLFAQTQAKEPSKEQLTVPLSSPDKPYTLKVNLVSGAIKVSTYAGKEIIIDVLNGSAKKEEDEEGSGSGSGMRRIPTGPGYEISAHEDNNTVSVHSGNPNQRVDLALKIPANLKHLSLHTVNGGDILVENVKGELEITNVNGGIRLKDVAGSVVANTVNGSVMVNLLSIDPTAPMAFSTLNGNIDVTLPGDTKADMKLKSDRGEVFSDFDFAINKSEPKVQKSESSGMYKLVLEDWVRGKVNGGGPEMMMKTMQGQIYIRRGK